MQAVQDSIRPDKYTNNPAAARLWSDLIEVYEGYLGDETELWEDRRKEFDAMDEEVRSYLSSQCHEACRRMVNAQHRAGSRGN